MTFLGSVLFTSIITTYFGVHHMRNPDAFKEYCEKLLSQSKTMYSNNAPLIKIGVSA